MIRFIAAWHSRTEKIIRHGLLRIATASRTERESIAIALWPSEEACKAIEPPLRGRRRQMIQYFPRAFRPLCNCNNGVHRRFGGDYRPGGEDSVFTGAIEAEGVVSNE